MERGSNPACAPRPACPDAGLPPLHPRRAPLSNPRRRPAPRGPAGTLIADWLQVVEGGLGAALSFASTPPPRRGSFKEQPELAALRKGHGCSGGRGQLAGVCRQVCRGESLGPASPGAPGCREPLPQRPLCPPAQDSLPTRQMLVPGAVRAEGEGVRRAGTGVHGPAGPLPSQNHRGWVPTRPGPSFPCGLVCAVASPAQAAARCEPEVCPVDGAAGKEGVPSRSQDPGAGHRDDAGRGGGRLGCCGPA